VSIGGLSPSPRRPRYRRRQVISTPAPGPAKRDTRPERWYRKADGTPDRPYNDLPPQYRGNLATGRPFDGGFRPSDRDIADLLAFLRTLNDADQTTPLNRHGTPPRPFRDTVRARAAPRCNRRHLGTELAGCSRHRSGCCCADR
jgi:hypothetical protein